MKKIITILLFFISINTAKAISLNTEQITAMDMNSGRVFYEKNSNEKRLIASTTKIMTALLAIENGNLEDIVEAKEEILTMYGSNIYLEYGEHMLLLDLIYGLMLRSGNDAAVTIANYIGGTEKQFVNMMNKKAKELGMNDTVYENPHGLDEETKNYSTSHDLAILYSYAYKNKIFRTIVGTKYYKVETEKKSYTWKNRNELLFKYDKATGGKTGYTPMAKRVLVSSASNNNSDIVVASFNTIYDYDLHRNIYEDIFYNYSNVTILNKDNFSLKNNPYEGKLYIKESLVYPLTNQERNNITKKVEFTENKNIKNNTEVGKIYVYLNDDLIKTTPIYIKTKTTSIKQKVMNFFSKILAKKD